MAGLHVHRLQSAWGHPGIPPKAANRQRASPTASPKATSCAAGIKNPAAARCWPSSTMGGTRGRHRSPLGTRCGSVQSQRGGQGPPARRRVLRRNGIRYRCYRVFTARTATAAVDWPGGSTRRKRSIPIDEKAQPPASLSSGKIQVARKPRAKTACCLLRRQMPVLRPSLPTGCATATPCSPQLTGTRTSTIAG